MAKKLSTNFEESIHYDGQASARFYPGAHYYSVTDKFIHPITGEEVEYTNKRMGGGTSITGLLAKGQGLMLYPMYEMKKYLKLWARATTVEEMFNSPLNWEDILRAGTQAHTTKSDRGKNVGTDAHSFCEAYLKELLRVQEETEKPHLTGDKTVFQCPEIPDVEEIAVTLRKSYLAVYNSTKPANIDDYKKLSRLLFQDAEIQEAIWIEANMLRRATLAAKEWMDMHEIFVHGTEDTVYSRIMQVCGKYDGDLSVTCTEKCNWCYRNGNTALPEEDFTGRYIEDYKSTNASTEAPKGIYSEYLIQCGVYDVAKTEEFPEIKYDGHLIMNGSKNEITNPDGSPKKDKKGNPLRAFNSHFSFNRERNRHIAETLAGLRDPLYEGKKEVEASA